MLSTELRQTAQNLLPTTLDAFSTLCDQIQRADPNIDVAVLFSDATLSAFSDLVNHTVPDSKTRQYIRALQSSKWCLPPWRAYLDLHTAALRSRDFMAALNQITDVLDYPTALRFLNDARDSRQSAPMRGVSKTSDRTAKDVKIALELSGTPAATRAPPFGSKKRKRVAVGMGNDGSCKDELGSCDMTGDKNVAKKSSDDEDCTDEKRHDGYDRPQHDDDGKAGHNKESGNHHHVGDGIEANFDGDETDGMCKRQKATRDGVESNDRLRLNYDNDNDFEDDFSNLPEPDSDSEQASPADHHAVSRTEVSSGSPGHDYDSRDALLPVVDKGMRASGEPINDGNDRLGALTPARAGQQASRRLELGMFTPSSCILTSALLVQSRAGPFALCTPTPLGCPPQSLRSPLTLDDPSSIEVDVHAQPESRTTRRTHSLPVSPPKTLPKTAGQTWPVCEQSRTSDAIACMPEAIEIGDDVESSTPKAPFRGLSDRAFDSLHNTRWLSSDAVLGLLSLFNPDPERNFVVDPGLIDGTGNPVVPGTLQDSHRKLLFPFCWWGYHWTIGIFDRDRMSIEVYDPLHSSKTVHDTAAAIDRLLVCFGEAKDATAIAHSSTTELKQTNGHDCGIYASVVGIFWMFQTPIPLKIEPSTWRHAGRIALSSVEPHLVLADSELPAVCPTLSACPPDTTAEEACADIRIYMAANEVVLHQRVESPEYTHIASFASQVAAAELESHNLRQSLRVRLNRELRLREETSRCPPLPIPAKLTKIRAVLTGVEAIKKGLRRERDVIGQFVGILKERAKRCFTKEVDAM